jgi:imidazolonepropionase-like amidohydrolase
MDPRRKGGCVTTLYRPELLLSDVRFVRNAGLLVNDDGKILAVTLSDAPSDTIVDLPGKALLPGFVNVHSHSFQRLIRGKSESRAVAGKDFWSWRGTMYHAAAKLEPKQVYDVACMAFLEMALAGTTTVGEFHYLHTAPTAPPRRRKRTNSALAFSFPPPPSKDSSATPSSPIRRERSSPFSPQRISCAAGDPWRVAHSSPLLA